MPEVTSMGVTYEKLSASAMISQVILGRVVGSSALFRREFLDAKAAYRHCRIEDADFMLRLLSVHRNTFVGYVRARLYGYRISAGQKTKKRIATDLGSINLIARVALGAGYRFQERITAVWRISLQTLLLIYHFFGFSGHPFRRRNQEDIDA